MKPKVRGVSAEESRGRRRGGGRRGRGRGRGKGRREEREAGRLNALVDCEMEVSDV